MQTVVEDCLALNANLLAKGGWFADNLARASGTIRWGNDNNISATYKPPYLTLHYTLNGTQKEQNIYIAQAPCHFGGKRYYFTCPNCQRRRYKLRLSGQGFYCRHCYRLTYYSQQCGDLDRLIHRKHKVEAKLEDPNRPPMRTTTRMKLIDQLIALDDQIDRAMLARFGSEAMAQMGVF